MKDFIAACAQIAITPNDVDANVAKGVEWLRRAVQEYQADLVAFPETVTTGYDTGLSAEGLWDLVDEAPGRITGPVQAAAKELGVYVVWPSYRRAGESGMVYNSAILIGPDGESAGIYDKTHPAPWERRDGGAFRWLPALSPCLPTASSTQFPWRARRSSSSCRPACWCWIRGACG